MRKKMIFLLQFIFLIVSIGTVTSCVKTLNDLKKELAMGGFGLWYPAEAGISAGQIWQMNGEQKDILFFKPQSLQVSGPNPLKFNSIEKEISADISLDASFADQFLGKVGPLSATLKNSTVTSVSIDFGATEVERLPLGQLKNENTLASLPQEYRDALSKVRAGQQDYVFIAAVVTTSGLKYVFKCQDSTALEANAPKIAELIGAKFDIKIVSKTDAEWVIPNSQRMAIGVSPIIGEMLNMSDLQIKEALKPLLMVDRNIKSLPFFKRLREFPKKIDTKKELNKK